MERKLGDLISLIEYIIRYKYINNEMPVSYVRSHYQTSLFFNEKKLFYLFLGTFQQFIMS